MANSLAIIVDSIYLFADFIRYISSLIFIYLAQKSTNAIITLGYKKIKLLGMGLSIMTTIILSFIFIYKATERIIAKYYIRDPAVMLFTSLLGMLINLIIFKSFNPA